MLRRTQIPSRQAEGAHRGVRSPLRNSHGDVETGLRREGSHRLRKAREPGTVVVPGRRRSRALQRNPAWHEGGCRHHRRRRRAVLQVPGGQVAAPAESGGGRLKDAVVPGRDPRQSAVRRARPFSKVRRRRHQDGAGHVSRPGGTGGRRRRGRVQTVVIQGAAVPTRRPGDQIGQHQPLALHQIPAVGGGSGTTCWSKPA